MAVDFERMRAAGRSPLESAAAAERLGMSRLEVFKEILTHWGTGAFAADQLLRYGSGYPTRAAHAAATVGLAAVVLEYPHASREDFAAFERVTGIGRKVDAMARADRADGALEFYDRLDPRTLSLTPKTESEARRTVLSMRASGSPLLSVVIDTVERHQWGWLFSPQLAESDPAVRPRQPGARARSILFDRFSGLAIELGLDEPTSLHVRRYEATWWPFRL